MREGRQGVRGEAAVGDDGEGLGEEGVGGVRETGEVGQTDRREWGLVWRRVLEGDVEGVREKGGCGGARLAE